MNPQTDIIPERRGIKVVCVNPRPDCMLLAFKKMKCFEYQDELSSARPLRVLRITAPDTMDTLIPRYLYGIAFNVCAWCENNGNSLMQGTENTDTKYRCMPSSDGGKNVWFDYFPHKTAQHVADDDNTMIQKLITERKQCHKGNKVR